MNERILNISIPTNQEVVITKPERNNNIRENLLDYSTTFIIISGGLLLITGVINICRQTNLKKNKKRSLFETDRGTTCKNCRFFSHNPYLKCALHPSKVSTTESIDCQDFWSNQSDRFTPKAK